MNNLYKHGKIKDVIALFLLCWSLCSLLPIVAGQQDQITASIVCESANVHTSGDSIAYKAYLEIKNVGSETVDVFVRRLSDDGVVATVPELKSGQSVRIDLSGMSQTNPVELEGLHLTYNKRDKKGQGELEAKGVTCPLAEVKPALEVSKQCETRLAPMKNSTDDTLEGKIYVTGFVKNTGNVDLKDVVVEDDDGFAWEFAYINVGDSLFFSRSVKINDPLTEQFNDTVTAYGVSVLPAGSGKEGDKISSAPVTATCPGLGLKPSLALEKECELIKSKSDDAYEFMKVMFSGRAINTGNVELKNVYIIDDSGTPDDESDDHTFGPYRLLPGATIEFSGEYNLTPGRLGDINNTVIARAETLVWNLHPLEALPVSAHCGKVAVSPALELHKNCTVSISESSDPRNRALRVDFEGRVVNTGDITLINVIVTDDSGTPSDNSDDTTFGPWTLAPGESKTFSGFHLPSDPTLVSYTDTMTARGDNSLKGYEGAEAAPVSAVCKGIKPNPSLVLTKECRVESMPSSEGNYLEVRINIAGTIKNSGDIDVIDITVYDDDGFTWQFDHIPAGETRQFFRTHIPSDPSLEYYNDTVTASGSMIAGLGSVSASPVTATCKGIKINPSLAVEKECEVSLEEIMGSSKNYSSGSGGYLYRYLIKFTGKVTNTGDFRLREVYVRDDAGTPSDNSDDSTFGPFDLAPGESATFSGSHYPSASGPSFTDTVTAWSAHPFKGRPDITAPPASATCERPEINPSLQLLKNCTATLRDLHTHTPSILIEADITLINNGDVPLHRIIVIDDMGTPDDTSDDKSFGPLTLAPGERRVLYSSHVVDSDDLSAESFSDSVRATAEIGIPGYDLITVAPVTAVCKRIAAVPNLVLTKTCEATTEEIMEGDQMGRHRVVINIEGTVRNTGNVLLSDILITDNDGYTWNFSSLAIGETRYFSRRLYPSNPAAANFNDTIIATARAPRGLGEVSSAPITAVCSGIASKPELKLNKECRVELEPTDEQGRNSRLIVRFFGSILNSGSDHLINVIVIDDMGTPDDTSDDKSFGPYNLAPGESASFSGYHYPASANLTEYQDTLRATADNRLLGFLGATASPYTAKCKGIPLSPALLLQKRCDVKIIRDYQIIVEYSGSVKNTGTLRLNDVRVIDDMGTPDDTSDDRTYGPFDLLPGESRTFSGSYYPTDAMAEYHTDTVRAEGISAVQGYPNPLVTPVSATCKGIKFAPKLELTKQCVVDTERRGLEDIESIRLLITGTATNSGDIRLMNVTITDDDGFQWHFDRLEAGETRTFERVLYPSPTGNDTFTDTIIATADLPGALGSIQSSPVSANCQRIQLNPSMLLNKTCETLLIDSNEANLKELLVRFAGSVSNNGNVRLVNVRVIDDMGTPDDTSDDLAFGPWTLLPGQTRLFSGEYRPADASLASFSDHVRATADSGIYGLASLSQEATATCQGIEVAPALDLKKECYVELRLIEEEHRVLVFFNATITNTGNVPLRNVILVDDHGTPSDASDDETFGPFLLAPGASRTVASSYEPYDNTLENHTDRIHASADSTIKGFPGIDLIEAMATCRGIQLHPEMILTKECIVDTFVDSEGLHRLRVNILATVRNSGDIELMNIVVRDDDGFTWTIPSLAVGETRNLNRTLHPAQDEVTAPYFEDTISATADVPAGFGSIQAAPITARCQGLAFRPELILTKECFTTLIDTMDDRRSIEILYNGTVTNSGNVTLINVRVIDDHGTPSDMTDDILHGPFTLQPGESRAFSGSYLPSSTTAASFQDTVRASADNLYWGFPGATAEEVTATCQGLLSRPSLLLTKDCEVRFEPPTTEGERVMHVYYSGTITNNGDVELFDVFVIDDHGTPSDSTDDIFHGPFRLLPGASEDFTGDYFPDMSGQHNADYSMEFLNTVRAVGTNIIEGHPNATAAPVSATCRFPGLKPALELTKTCESRLVPYPSSGLAAQRVIIVVNGTVRNSGDVELYDVTVFDNDGFSWSIGYLPAGESRAFSRIYVPIEPTADSFEDTISARGRLPSGLGSVSAAHNVTATCQGISIVPRFTIEKECEVRLVDSTNFRQRIRIFYSGRVSNVGDVALADLIIRDDRGTPSDSSDDIFHGPFDLAPGQSATFEGSYYPLPGTETSEMFTDTVWASANSTVIGFPGTLLQNASATCAGIVTRPSLLINKTCETILEEQSSVYSRVRVNYSGTLANNGDVALVDVMIHDDRGTPADETDDMILGPFHLLPGESVPFSGYYYPATPDALSHTDRVYATASHGIEGFPAPAQVEAIAECAGIMRNASIRVTKVCETSLIPSEPEPLVRVTFNGTLTNEGEITVANIIVTDDRGTPSNTSDDITFGPFTLTPGQTVSFTSFYYPEDPTAPIQADTIRAVGEHGIIGFPQVLSNEAMAECEGIQNAYPPSFALTKECYVRLIHSDASDLMSDLVPTIYISGSVINTGPIELENIVIRDSDGYTWNFTSLLAGQTLFFTRTVSVSAEDAMDLVYSDTISATADAILGLGPVSADAVSASCSFAIAPELSLQKNCLVKSRTVGSGDSARGEFYVMIEGVVRNTGNVSLADIMVIDDAGTPDDTSDDLSFGPFWLAPGTVRTFEGSYVPLLQNASTYSDRMRATSRPAIIGFANYSTIIAETSAECAPELFTPRLLITKTCEVRLEWNENGTQSMWVYWSAVLSNSGNVRLVNVLVRDDMGTPDDTSDDMIFPPIPVLLAGERRVLSGRYMPGYPTNQSFSDTITASAEHFFPGLAAPAPVSSTAVCRGISRSPSLELRKECFARISEEQNGVLLNFTGMVRNNGDVQLFNIIVIDDHGTPSDASDDVSFGPYSLLPGQSISFHGSYLASDPLASSFNDTLSATADVGIIGFGSIMATPVTASCQGIQVAPALELEKQCYVDKEYLQSDGKWHVRVNIRGLVRNSGDVSLHNVVVRDDDGFEWNIGSLAAGESRLFERTYLADDTPTLANFTDTVSATGEAILGLGTIHAAEVTATCQGIQTAPALQLEKDCYVRWIPVREDDLSELRVTVFYRGRVRNTGDVALMNVLVVDDKGTPSDSSDDITHGPFSLLPGQSAAFNGSYLPMSPTDAQYTDRVSATGENTFYGHPGATATPVTANCQAPKNAPALKLTKRCRAFFVADDSDDRMSRVAIQWFGTVTNIGQVPLVGVNITNDMGTPDDSSDDLSFGPFFLLPGEARFINGTYYPSSSNASAYSDSLRAVSRNAVTGFPGVEAETSARCELVAEKPALELKKECEVCIEEEQGEKVVKIKYSGYVINSGSVRLLDIMVTDDRGTPSDLSDDFTHGPFDLLPGERAHFEGEHIAMTPNLPRFNDTVTARARVSIRDYADVIATPVTASCEGLKIQPELKLQKECKAIIVDSTENMGRKSVRVQVNGYVHNMGNIDLINVVVRDDDGFNWTIGNLRVGEMKEFSRIIIPSNPMADSFTDTITATADAILGFGSITSAPVSAVCEGIKTRPDLWLEKECEARIVESTSSTGRQEVRVFYSGSVMNSGDVDLHAIHVVDDAGTPDDTSDDITHGPFDLAIGEIAVFNGSYLPRDPTAEHFMDRIYANGENNLEGFPGVTWSPSAMARCRGVFVHPRLDLEKHCEAITEDLPDGRRQLLVRYFGRVTNTGNVALINVFVNHSSPDLPQGMDSEVFGPFTLAPGEFAEFESRYIPTNPMASNFTDSVSAVGELIILGFENVESESVTAVCRGMKFNPEMELSKECRVKLETKDDCVLAVKILYSGNVTNTGDIKLLNVSVRDDKGTPNDLSDDEYFGPFDLEIGETYTFNGHYYPCIDVSNSTKLSDIEFMDTVTVIAQHQMMGWEVIEPKSVSAHCYACVGPFDEECC